VPQDIRCGVTAVHCGVCHTPCKLHLCAVRNQTSIVFDVETKYLMFNSSDISDLKFLVIAYEVECLSVVKFCVAWHIATC
jgi:hypothetical protein